MEGNMNLPGAFGEEPVDRTLPWQLRASLTPRRTYSAESVIVYKRKKHEFTIKDAERVMAKAISNAEANDREGQIFPQSLFDKFLAFLDRLGAWILKKILPGAVERAGQR
jgi:hypothetical protein